MSASDDGVDVVFPTEVHCRFAVGSPIGQGAYATVYKAQVLERRGCYRRRVQRSVGAVCGFVALKCCVDGLDERDHVTLQRLYRELTIHRQLRHEHIVVLRDAIMSPNSSDMFFVVDLMQNDLDYAIRFSCLDESQQCAVLAQTLRGLMYLHSSSLLHRDLNPKNILLDVNGNAKLCDFSLVRQAGIYSKTLTVYVAARCYRAVELLLGSTRYTDRIDIWALGCVAGEMILGRPLLRCSSAADQVPMIVGLLFGRCMTEDESYVDGLQEDALLRFAKTQPEGQTVEDLLGSLTQARFIDFVRCCLKLSPDERPSARELLLEHPLLEACREDRDSLRFQEHITMTLADGNVHSASDLSREIAAEIELLRREAAEQGDESDSASDSEGSTDAESLS
eukprot:TRINITY_DN101622_c0_g1_i1.p1 TRINITY_DN101622_c0_g1~~TRINITY_DN101622_c0_g1_i1.p1  ORF type:complete len:394 (+),score=77.53 TRINITY_DN101622_c0_g1_i1:126-1307(+)